MNDQRAREAVEHLQAAALEVIASMRAVLDVAESVVRDPSQAAHVMRTVDDLAAPAGAARPETASEDGRPWATGPVEGVTRIHVS